MFILNLVILLLKISECHICALSFNTLYTCVFHLLVLTRIMAHDLQEVVAPAKLVLPVMDSALDTSLLTSVLFL